MDNRTFIANVVASLAWPATALIALLLVRRILISLLPLVRTLSYSELEVSFGREIAAVREAADDAAIRPSAERARPQVWEDLMRLAAVRLEVLFGMPGVKWNQPWRGRPKQTNFRSQKASGPCPWCLAR